MRHAPPPVPALRCRPRAAPLALRAAFAWPDQPIKLVVPFTPGTGPDIIARFVAERLSPRLGQPVVVENVAGASGNIGSQQVARAKPDGHTLMSSVNTLVMNASLFKNLPYDPVADFAPLGLTAWGSLVLVAHPGQKPNTLGELVAAAKAAAQDADLRQPGRRHAASSFDGAGRDRIGHRAGARALQGHVQQLDARCGPFDQRHRKMMRRADTRAAVVFFLGADLRRRDQDSPSVLRALKKKGHQHQRSPRP